MPDQLVERLLKIERDHRRLRVLTTLLLVALMMVGTTAYVGVPALAQEDGTSQSITASRINIVDANGVVRLRIGSDLPDGVINGVRRPRAHAFAGILLYDDDGQERSGYGTMGGGNVGLTLDTRDLQSAFFLAGPKEGAALHMWNGSDVVDLRVDENGPSVHTTSQGRVTFHQPVIEDPKTAPFCRSYHDLSSRVSRDELLEACRKRRAESSCQACLSALE